ncbi:MAG: phosphoenolpyruvate--protein phosphotransferase [Eubacteriales bacterium]|nr:phosphoenolpyruvate--protein phosphotransferase [Eubacteriales bacterium]
MYTPKSDCDAQTEKRRLNDALKLFFEKNERLSAHVRETVGESAAEIIIGHMMMMKDPYMCSEIEKRIDAGQCAESAVEAVCDLFIAMFSAVDDEMTKQRATDVKDIKSEMLALLLGVHTVDLSDLPKDTVLVAKELTPSMTACISRKNVVGFITEVGSKTSHAAILARAMEIPAVLSVENATENLKDNQLVIVDGIHGEVLTHPKQETVAAYLRLRMDFEKERAALAKFVGLETRTQDGEKVQLFANIGTPEDASQVIAYDGEGVGLFRTEFLFMDRNTLPDENEQFEAYKKALLIMKNKTVIIRTLDIGGDKEIPYLGMKKEENPFLGFRAVRYCLKNSDMYKTQLRALLRASAYGDLRIMIPLVTGVDEVRQVKTLIREIRAELDEKVIAYNKDLKIGVMIETPSAAILADVLAKEADFFSIGTNDLTGYTMAVDRGNADVAYLYSAFSPAVLRMIRHIISEGKKAGIPVGMCGEAAADPLLIPLLISFGLDEYSVNPTSLLATRREISRWSKQEADKIAESVMALKTEKQVISELSRYLNM